MSAERGKRWQSFAVVAVTAVLALVIVWVNTYQRMREQYALAEKHDAAGEYLQAVTAYETAIHAYVPWSSRLERSIQRLWEIGQMYEQRGETDMALIAYRSLRSSLLAVRSVYQPYPEWIRRCNERIPFLLSLQDGMEIRDRNEPAPAPPAPTPLPG